MKFTAQDLARRAAARLAPQVGQPALPMRVEAILMGGDSKNEHFDAAVAIAFASFLVSAATLAWKIWQDTRPPKLEVVRTVRVELILPERITDAQRDQIIEGVVAELPES